MEKIQKDGLPGHKYYMEVEKAIHQCENCTDEKAANVYRDKEFITKCALTALEIYNNEYSDEKIELADKDPELHFVIQQSGRKCQLRAS